MEPYYKNKFITFFKNATSSVRGRAAGGLIIWVRLLHHYRIKQMDTSTPDMLGINIHRRELHSIKLFNIYNHPQPSNKESMTITLLDFLIRAPLNTINIIETNFNVNFEPPESTKLVLQEKTKLGESAC